MNDAAPIHQLALYSALTAGDLPAAYAAARALLDEGETFDSILSTALAPAQREVGRRWAQNDVGIADEHAATATLQQLLTLLTAAIEPTDSVGHVVVACVEGDWHGLAAQAVAAALQLRGWQAISLGPSVPAVDLSVFVAEHAPDAVALSCSHPRALLGARHSIDAVRAMSVPVIAGGRAFGSSDRRALRLGAHAWAATANAAADLLDAGLGDAPPWVELPRTPELVAEVSGLVAETAARDQHVGTIPIRAAELARELHDTLDVAASAILVDERELVAEYARWQRDMLVTRGVRAEQFAAALSAARQHPALPEDAATLLGSVVATVSAAD